jgi:hypothetical protein
MAVFKIVKGSYTNKDAIKKLVSYIYNSKDTPTAIFGSVGANDHDKDLAIEQFYTLQKKLRNCKGKRIIHMVVSFDKNETKLLPISSYQKIAYNIMDFFNNQYQIIFGLHEKVDQYHIHFALNPVSVYTGKKLHWNRSEISQFGAWVQYVSHNEITINS